VLETSFAQFQADRAVVDLARKVRTQQESLDGYARSMQCHLGDFGEYTTIRRELGDLEKQGAARADAQSRAEHDKRQRHLADLRRRLRQHPCHACPEREQHARWSERWWKLKKQTDQLSAQIRGRTGAVAKVFDRVTDVLLDRGYLEPASPRSSTSGAAAPGSSRRGGDRTDEVAVTSTGRTLRRP